ncbi:MAG: right-handed parallel beta-helix repeat-containing protein [Dokdonella sp.]
MYRHIVRSPDGAAIRAHALHLTLLLLLPAPTFAATFNVDVETDSVDAIPGDGLCADAKGACSLRAAIMESNSLAGHDAITLAAGHFTLNIAGIGEDASAQGDLDVTDDVALSGAGSEASVIDGAAIDRVLDLLGGAPHTVRLEGLAVRNGFVGTSTWTGSFSGLGGVGIRVGAGTTLAMSHVDIRDNHSANMFGAVAIDNAGCIEGDHVRIVGNTDLDEVGSASSVSGGIETDGEDTCLVLDDSEISGNRGDKSGALHVDGGASVTLRRTLVADNVARFSGALELNQGDEVLLDNVTISGNAGDPGAILNDGGTHLILRNSTVTGNHASASNTNVGGIYDVHGGFGLTFLSNSILAGNGPGFIADDCKNVTSVGGGNLIGDSERCHVSTQPSDLLDVDPGLGALGDNGGFTRTHLPGPNAIDHGVDGACLADDQRGGARPLDGDDDGAARCDIGAVEAGGLDLIFVDGFDSATRSHPSPHMHASNPRRASAPRTRRPQGT